MSGIVTDRRIAELHSIVRNQVAGALQSDLDGGERIMKEAWEQCKDDNEQAVMEFELARIIKKVKR